MKDRKSFITYIYGMVSIIMWFVAFLLVLALTSCKDKQYITVEKTKTDTLYNYKVRVDSIVKFDSITTVAKGDTVFRDRWHTLHVYHNSVDTVFRVRIVKEPQPYPVEKIVEVNKLYWWQETLMWSGAIFLLLVVGWIVLRLRKSK